MTTRLGDLLLFSLLPQLRAAEADLRYARVNDDREQALRGILKWREVMADVSGFLAARGLASKSDNAAIASCSLLAHTSEDVLAQGGGTAHEAVAELLREVGDLSVRLGEISARLLTEVRRVPT